MASPRGRPSTAPASSDHERALRHIHTWKRHCANLRSMHESGSRGSSTQSLQLACGVCGVYGLESLYSLHNGSVKEQDVQSGAGELMGFVKWGLVEGDANKPSKIDPALETAGTMALLEFASSIFHRANSVEKALIDSGALEVDERWGSVRGLYYSAWEFFGVVSWMEVKGKVPADEVKGIGEKRRYATWRATEIWKAQREGRAVNVQGIETVGGTRKAVNVGDPRSAEDPSSAVGTTSAKDTTQSVGPPPSWPLSARPTSEQRLQRHPENLRPMRSYKVGDVVWYSQVLRACSRVKARVTRVCSNGNAASPLYDIVEEKSGDTRQNVREETCAPMIEVGHSVVVGDTDGFNEAIVEEVYFSHWPPKYLCLIYGALEEVEDENLYHNEDAQELTLSSSEDNSEDEAEVHDVRAPRPPQSITDEDNESVRVHTEDAEEVYDESPADSSGEEYQAVTETDLGEESDETKEGLGKELDGDSEPLEKFPEVESEEEQHEQTDEESEEKLAGEGKPDDHLPAGPARRPPPPNPPVVTVATAASTQKHTAPVPARFKDDIVSLTKAEKLCRSAISCISFGDAPSAVRFLKDALDTLQPI